ncbi:hypothetical protein B938_11570 [Bacillus velezensis AS43.3]|nr:hypothetical protein B938_11570 [Bacillus velezensis AS43.3]
MSRLVALLILVLPGAVAALGIKLMRDALFGHAFSPFPSLFLQGAAGLAFFFVRPLCSGRVYSVQRSETQSSQPAVQEKKAVKKALAKKGLFQSSGSIVLAMD